MIPPARPLQRRLMLAFSGFVLFATGLFGLYALAFMYSVEDAFFEAMLDQEVSAQLGERARSGQWATPRDPSMTIHADTAGFPVDLKAQHDAEPWRHEFPGRDARHYHVRAIDAAPATPRVWLVAEVSAQLVVRPMRDRVFLLLACSGLLLVAAALLLGYWLARRTAAPLSRLATMIDGMAPGRLPRNLAQRFDNDEVGILARGLDALIDRVHAFITREQEFTRDASHELRTPLAVIRSAAERLIADPGLSPAGRQQLGYLQQSAMQLEQTVTTLLTLAREDPSEAAQHRVRIVPILERVIVEQSPLLEGKDVTVAVDVPHDARIALPAPVMHILLSNLIGNAFAHTIAGAVRIDVDQPRLRIRNSGEEAAAALRWPSDQPFIKGESSHGFGLGLAILSRLCDRYGIDLRIERVDGGVIASIAIAIDGTELPAPSSS